MDKNINEVLINETIKGLIDNNYLPPLFHGTNSKSLEMNEEERNDLRQSCEVLLQILTKFVEDKGKFMTDEIQSKMPDIYDKVKDAWLLAKGREKKLATYEYNNIYLTFSADKAWRFARRAVVIGETGYATFWLLQAAERMGLNRHTLTKVENEALTLFNSYVEKQDNPIVLMFHGLKKDDVREEKGEELDEGSIQLSKEYHDGNVRVVTEHFNVRDGRQITEEDANTIRHYMEEEEQIVREMALSELHNMMK